MREPGCGIRRFLGRSSPERTSSFKEDLVTPNRDMLQEIAWVIVPEIIPLLRSIVPPEDEI